MIRSLRRAHRLWALALLLGAAAAWLVSVLARTGPSGPTATP